MIAVVTIQKKQETSITSLILKHYWRKIFSCLQQL